MVDTYYTPSGGEHLIQTPVEDEVLDTIAERVFAGEHVHSWSKDQGTRCYHKDGTYEQVPRRGTCQLGDKGDD